MQRLTTEDIRVGDELTAGRGEARNAGRVLAIHGADVFVHWYGGAIVATTLTNYEDAVVLRPAGTTTIFVGATRWYAVEVRRGEEWAREEPLFNCRDEAEQARIELAFALSRDAGIRVTEL